MVFGIAQNHCQQIPFCLWCRDDFKGLLRQAIKKPKANTLGLLAL